MPEVWAYKDTRFMIGPSNIQHDLSVADLFSAVFPTGKLKHWDSYWYESEKHQAKEFGVYYDARMVLENGAIFFWEVDRGTEPIYKSEDRGRYDTKRWEKSLNGKIEKYIRLSNENHQNRFNVLFTVADHRYGKYDHDRTMDRAEQILQLLAYYGRGNQFLVAVHNDIVGDRFYEPGAIHNELAGDPFGRHFISPRDPETPLSLLEI